MALIGLDIGTTGCKALVFSDDLKLLASVSREYRVDIPHPQWAEQDAENVWMLAKECLRESVTKSGVADSTAAIGLSVQGEAVMPVDMQGNPLRPMILGMDTRTDDQNKELRERFGAQALFELTGMPIHTINTLPKLLWLKQNEKDIWNNADRFMLYEDSIIHKMTGNAFISRCLASRTQLYDLKQNQWSKQILEYLELESSKLSEPHPSGFSAGNMLPVLAEELGFTNPPIISTGGHDQACGALGAGLTKAGLAMVSTGTAEVVEVAMDSLHLNQTLYQGNMSVYQHTFPGLYVVMTLNQSGGFILRWFRDTFCQDDISIAAQEGRDVYDMLLEGTSPEPSPVLILPHFSGSGTPTFDTQSKGAILGLTFATTKKEIVKGILDALTLELRLNLEILQKSGISIHELRAIGGGAKSALWLQLKTDITGIPVAAPEVTEAAGLGAAILAGCAARIFDNPAIAIDDHLKIRKIYRPNPINQALFDRRFELYQQLYPAVKEINHTL